MTKKKTEATTATAAPPDIGALYLAYRRLEREHAEIRALDGSRGDVSYSRGELTQARDAALAAVRAAADAVIDGGEK